MAAFTILAAISFMPTRPIYGAANTVDFCFNSWPPYAWVEDGEPVGISIDILREAARRAGLTATFGHLPWKRCLQLVQEGKFDAVVDAAERDEFTQGPSSYVVYTDTIWVREDDPLTAANPQALRGRTLGIVDGYHYGNGLTEDPRIVLEPAVNDEMNIRKLAFGRVDAIIADFTSTMAFALANQLRIRPLLPHISFDRLYPSFNKGRGKLQASINRAIAKMLEDGFVDRVYRKHIGSSLRELEKAVAATVSE